MTLQNTDQTYGSVAKFLHWVIALGIIGLIIMGFCLHSIPASKQYLFYTLHKSFGLTILFLMVIRLIWRLQSRNPRLPSSTPAWQKLASRTVHLFLYIAALGMPISGWIMSTAAGHSPNWFFLVTLKAPGIDQNRQLTHIASDIHHIGAFIIATLIIIHIGAALKHHFINKDNVYIKMLPRFVARKMR